MSAELCAVKKLSVLLVSTAGASSEVVVQNLTCVGASSWSHRVSLPSCASMSGFSGAGTEAAPSPGRSPQSLEFPCSDPLPGHLHVVLSPQHGSGTRLPRTVAMSLFSVTFLLVPLPSARR